MVNFDRKLYAMSREANQPFVQENVSQCPTSEKFLKSIVRFVTRGTGYFYHVSSTQGHVATSIQLSRTATQPTDDIKPIRYFLRMADVYKQIPNKSHWKMSMYGRTAISAIISLDAGRVLWK